MAEALAKRGADVTGIDPAKQAIAAARTHAAEEGLSVHYDIGVGEHLPYSANAFDAVVCVDVLEHVEDLDKVIAESARVLKPGGLFLFDIIVAEPGASLTTRNWKAGAERTFLTALPHCGHSASGGSLIRCRTSVRWPHSVHSYS